MKIFCLFFLFFYPQKCKKVHFSVIQYVKDHPIHTRKSADFAIAHLRVRAFELTPKVK